MSDSDEPIVVNLYVATGFVGGTYEDEIEVPRDRWERMSTAQRSKYLDDRATELMEEHIERGWTILSGADDSDTDG